MKLPIPQDWDGETWECYQIQWPVSIEYRAILIGLLSFMTRGRAWDERSGAILQAQQIAWEIFDRNNPLLACTVPTGGEIPPIITQNGAVYALIGDDNMGIFLTDIYIDENGRLIKVYGPCCEKPVLSSSQPATDTEGPSIGDIPTNWDDPLDAIPDLEPPANEPPTSGLNWACRKAWTLGKATEDYFIAAQGARNMTPWAGANYLQDQLEYLHLDNKEALDAYVGIQLWERTIPLITISWTTEQTENLICKLAPKLDDQSSAMTEEEFQQFYFALDEAAGGGGTIESDMYVGLIGSIGKSNFRRAIAEGIFFEGADCTCPEGPMVPDDEIYFTGQVINTAELANAADGLLSVASLDDNFQTLNANWAGTTSSGSTDRCGHYLLNTLVPVSSVTLRFEGIPPTLNWVDSPPPAYDWSNVQHGSFEAAEQSVVQTWTQTSVGADFVEWRCDFTISAVAANVHLLKWGYPAAASARWWGRNAPNPFSRDWAVKIIAVAHV